MIFEEPLWQVFLPRELPFGVLEPAPAIGDDVQHAVQAALAGRDLRISSGSDSAPRRDVVSGAQPTER